MKKQTLKDSSSEERQNKEKTKIKYPGWKKEKWINEKMKAIAKEVFGEERTKEKKANPKIKEVTKTLVPGLIHLIKEDGVVKYLLKDGNSFKIVGEYKTDKEVCKPKQDLPIEFASKEILDIPFDLDYEDLLDEVVLFIRSYVEMPSESDYLYLALWVLHSYLIEKFDVTPLLYFHGVQVTGKTRAGEVLAKISFKCERLTSPTEATLFRGASYFKNALVIDEIKLWGSDANQDVQNLIKSRYKRGLKVQRLNMLKDGEDQMEYFDVFAPLVICTTEGLDPIIESRCLLFSMQPNASQSVEKRIDEKKAQELRNKLTIFRANEIDKEFKNPSSKEVGRRRLGEILTPLWQVLMLTSPVLETEFKSTLKEIERAKADEEGMSFEADIVGIITKSCKEENIDFILTKDVSNVLNEDRTEKAKVSDMLVASRIKRLGFKKRRETTTRRQGFTVRPELLEKLQERFGLEKWVLSPETQKQKEFNYEKEEKNKDEV
jgi:hypothetical protein